MWTKPSYTGWSKELRQNVAEKIGHCWALTNLMRWTWIITIQEAQVEASVGDEENLEFKGAFSLFVLLCFPYRLVG